MDLPIVVSSISWIDIVSGIILPILLPVLVGLASTSKWSVLAKRLSLGGLSLLTVILTDLVDAAVANTALDLGAIIFRFAITWGTAELAYYKLLKAPIEPQEPDTLLTVDVVNPEKLTKAELVTLINEPAVIEAAPAPRSIASIVQSHGAQG